MKILSVSIEELAFKYDTSAKQLKLILFCLTLIAIKFLVIPVLDWQATLKENIEFYSLQLRDESEIEKNAKSVENALNKSQSNLEHLTPYFFTGVSSSKAQIDITKKIEQYVASKDMDLVSKSSTELVENEDYKTLEFRFEVKGYAEQLQEFIFWIEQQKPLAVVQELSVRSSKRTAWTSMRIRVHYFVLKSD